MSDFEFIDEHKAYIEEFFDIIDSACHFLQEETDCPEEAINQLLVKDIGTRQLQILNNWMKP